MDYVESLQSCTEDFAINKNPWHKTAVTPYIFTYYEMVSKGAMEVYISSILHTTILVVSARKAYLQCISNGDMRFLH